MWVRRRRRQASQRVQLSHIAKVIYPWGSALEFGWREGRSARPTRRSRSAKLCHATFFDTMPCLYVSFVRIFIRIDVKVTHAGVLVVVDGHLYGYHTERSSEFTEQPFQERESASDVTVTLPWGGRIRGRTKCRWTASEKSCASYVTIITPSLWKNTKSTTSSILTTRLVM